MHSCKVSDIPNGEILLLAYLLDVIAFRRSFLTLLLSARFAMLLAGDGLPVRTSCLLFTFFWSFRLFFFPSETLEFGELQKALFGRAAS